MGLRADVADLTAALHAEAEKATGLAEALRGAEEAAAEAKAQHEQIQVCGWATNEMMPGVVWGW